MTIYEEWKKKHGLEGAPSSSSSLLDGYMKKKAETAYTKINEALSGYEASANNYIKNYNVRMSNRMKSEYVSDSEAWLSEITGQKEQFDNSAAQIKSLLDKYGKYYGEDYVNSVIRYLDGNAEKQSRITASASSDNDYWKQFSKEEYEGWYDSQIYGKKYEGKSYSDIEKALSSVSSDRERAWLSANADSFMSSADAQEEIDRLKKENAEKYGKYSSHTVDYMNEFHSGPIPVKTPVRNEALDRIKELEGIRDSAKNREELAAYEEKYLSAAYEYANKLSRHNIQKINAVSDGILGIYRQSDTAPIKRNTTGNVPGTEAEDFAFTETGQKMLNKAVDGLLNGITNRDFMSDGENKMLRYLVYEKGAKEAERYLNTLQPELNRRSAEQMKQTVSEMVSNGNAAEKTFYNVASIGMNIVGGPIAFLDNLEQYVKGERIDPNRPGQAMRQIGSTIRTETDAGIDNNVMSMLYNALMSSADSLVGAYTLGNLYTVSMGMGASASKAEEMVSKGASNSQIFTRSLSAGLAEYITEKVSIDNLIKPKDATGFLSAAKEILKQAGIEGSEEMASELLNLIADSAVMAGNSDFEQSSKRYRSGYTDENGVYHKGVSEAEAKKLAWRDFFTETFAAGLTGAISGGLGGTVSAAAQTASGEKVIFSENEQKVFDSLYAERLSEAEKSGKLSAKEKNRIRAELSEEMKNGYIGTDDIERVLGGESYNTYKNSLERENALKAKEKALTDEIEAILDKENPRIRDTERLSEARAELSKLRAELGSSAAETSDAKSKLFHEVDRLTVYDRFIRESYHEREKRGQVFEADLSRYDEKQRAIVKKAVDAGFLNNTGRTHEFVDAVAKIAADRGISFDFTNNAKLKESGFSVAGRTVNGYVTKEGITVNMDSPRAWRTVVGHEVTHILEGGELYTELQEAIFSYAKTKGEYDSRLDSIAGLYENIEGTDIESELTAELVGDYLFTDAAFVDSLSREHRNVFQRIYDEIKHLLKLATAGSREARALEKVKKAFDKAYRENSENGKKTDVGGNENKENSEDSNVKYSIKKSKEGVSYVDVESNSIQVNADGKTIAKALSEIVKNKFNQFVKASGQKIGINQRTANEWRKSKDAQKLLDNDFNTYADKIKAFNNADELLQVSRDYIGEKIKHIRKDNFIEFARGTVDFKVGENGYSADIIVGTTKSGVALLYDIVNLQKKEITEVSLTAQDRRYETSVNSSISQKESAVNSKDMQKPEKNSLSEDYLPIEEGDIAPVGKKGKKTDVGEDGVRYSIKYPSYSKNDYTSNSIKLQNMDSVISLSGKEFSDSNEPIRLRIQKYFASLGNNIYTDEFGDVALSNSSIRDDLGHGMTYNKIVSFAAIPEVLKNGVVIDSQTRGRGNYERIVVAAPIKIADDNFFMGVMLQRDNQSQRLYLHDVISVNKKEIALASGGTLSTTEPTKGKNNLYMTSILQNALLVNSKDMQKPEKNSLSEDYLPIEEGDIAPVRKKTADEKDGLKYSLSNAEESFGIQSVNDYIGVQKAVLNTLTSEGFFIDGNSVVTNTDSGMIVEITRDGIRETLGPGKRFDRLPKRLKQLKLATLRRLPEIISSASVSQDNVINRHNANSKAVYSYLTNNVNVDGEEYNVTVTVRKSPQKNKFWIHEVRLIKTEQDLSSSENSFPNKQQEYNEALAPENSISRDGGNVKKNSLFFENSFENNEDIAPVRRDQTALRDMRLEKEDIAPVREDAQTEEKLSRNASERVDETVSERRKELADRLKAFEKDRAKAKASFDEHIRALESQYKRLKNTNSKKAQNLLQEIEDQKAIAKAIDSELAYRIESLENKLKSNQSENRMRALQRKYKHEEYTAEIEDMIGDTFGWKDKRSGLSYQVNTLRRNLRDIVRDADGNPDFETADRIYDYLQGSYNHNEALLKKESEKLKKPFFDMKINRYESVYIQMLGEFKYNPETDLTRERVEKYYEANKKKIDVEKVNKAIEEARKIYDDLLHRVNAVLREQGMKEIGHKEGYFPHFRDEGQGFFGKLLNWKSTKKRDEIPTDIAGITEYFKPQRSWQSFSKHRTGRETAYNFAQGFDTYVHGALDWIYHLEDIQKRRAFEDYIRYTHSEKGVREQIDKINAYEELDAEEAQELRDAVYKNAANPLNNFIVDFSHQTNSLAGKKSSFDRGMEYAFGREIYSTMTQINNRVSANMIVGSIRSALTNLIPITQSWGEVSPVSSLSAVVDMIRSTVRDDGIIEKSVFLTNRFREEENLYKTEWDKVESAFGVLNIFDRISSEVVWRSKYRENLKAGMSENEAIKNADIFAENVIAGRSRGNMPTIFNAKNPFIKMATAFQLEVANQYGYMFKDMPQDIGKEKLGRLTSGYIKMFVGAYIYNALFSALTGSDAALDPIGILEELLRDLFGGDDGEEETDVAGALGGFAENVAQEIPFVGGFLGGGRVPISSALPYNLNVSELLDDIEGMGAENSEKYIKSFIGELIKPVTYVALPMGGGQLRKTVQGLSMFTPDKEVSGSYTDSGNLRFPVEQTAKNVVQAALFGQYASKNARDYFDNGYAPLTPKQTEEYNALDIPIEDYRKYKKGISEAGKTTDKNGYGKYIGEDGSVYWYDKENGTVYDEKYRKSNKSVLELKKASATAQKADYIASLPLSDEQKDILYGNAVSSSLTDEYGYQKYTDGDGNVYWYDKNSDTMYDSEYSEVSPEESEGIAPAAKPSLSGYDKFADFEEFDFYIKKPEAYALSRAITHNFSEYLRYTDEIDRIKPNYDGNGNAVSGSRKKKVWAYINGLDLGYGQKLLLFKSEYKTDASFDYRLIEYLGDREDISYEELMKILSALGLEKYRP